MDYMKEKEDTCEEEGVKNDFFFVDEGEIKFSQQKQPASRLSRESSPPLILAFTSGRALQGTSPSYATSLNSEEEEHQEDDEDDSDQHIEEWMMLGGEEQLGDSSIQLNLSYCNSDENDAGDEDPNVKTVKDTWAVSEKDKSGADQSLPIRYFGRPLICNICNKMGHLAKSCYYHKKCPICILCGIQGHIQRDCPARPCPSCGLPSHGFTRCDRPPTWNQHCQRCGMAGHLSDVCPDTWRQYHLTIQLEVPLRPHTVHTLKHKKPLAHCYNCSERGHYGYECTKRRMISGTSPSLPYVCHYDTMEDIFQCHKGIQKRAKEHMSSGSLTDQQYSEPRRESGEESHTVQGRSRTKQETCSRAGRRKTWPEKRRERREVKRLRREAQARREGGLLGRSRGDLEDEVYTADPFRPPLHGLSTAPPQMKRRDEEGSRRTRRSRETERFKKRRGIKHGDLCPYGDIHISGCMSSLEHRVRHRRR